MYETGSLFSIDKEMYMLVEHTNNRRALINLKDGRRFSGSSFPIQGKTTTWDNISLLVSRDHIKFISHSLKTFLDNKGKKLPTKKKSSNESYYLVFSAMLDSRFHESRYTTSLSNEGRVEIETTDNDILSYLSSLRLDMFAIRMSDGSFRYSIPRRNIEEVLSR